MSCCPKYIVPSEGLSRPPRRYSSVLLPAPDSPTSARRSPRFTWKERPEKITKSLPPDWNFLVRLTPRMAAASAGCIGVGLYVKASIAVGDGRGLMGGI